MMEAATAPHSIIRRLTNVVRRKGCIGEDIWENALVIYRVLIESIQNCFNIVAALLIACIRHLLFWINDSYEKHGERYKRANK
jgi:hypothetical protein